MNHTKIQGNCVFFAVTGSLVLWFSGSLVLWFSGCDASNSSSEPPGRLAARGAMVDDSLKPTSLDAPRAFAPLRKVVFSHQVVSKAYAQCVPIFRPPTVSMLIHELRLWGVNHDLTEYPNSRCKNSSEILLALTDEAFTQEVALGVGESNYLSASSYGLHVALLGRDCGQEARAEAHYGQLAAAFGVSGIRSSHPMLTDDGMPYPVRAYLDDLALGYRPDYEQEFMAIAFAHYLDAPYEWIDESGKSRDMGFLLNQLVSMPVGRGSCFGTHVPYAVAVILRMDDQTRHLSNENRQLGIDYLRSVLHFLKRSQEPSGSWLSWCDAPRPYQYGSELDDRINVTGHHLEWLALAPNELNVDLSMVQRGIDGLSKLLPQVLPADRRVFKSQLPLTHAARALVLWSSDSDGE